MAKKKKRQTTKDYVESTTKWNDEYNQFSEAVNLPPQLHMVYGLGTKVADGTATDSEFNSMMSYLSDVDFADNEQAALMMMGFAQDPEFQRILTVKHQQAKRMQISDRVRNGMDTLMGLVDVGIATGQIRRSNEELDRLRQSKPRSPEIRKKNRRLMEAMNQAQLKASGASIRPEVQAVRNEIADSYNAAIDQSRAVSGGQAGTFGAMAQSAYNMRNRAATQMAPFLAQVQRDYENQFLQLAQLQARDEQSEAWRRLNLYNTELGQYNREAQAAGAAGAAGRQNLRNALWYSSQGMANALGPLVGSYFMDDDEPEPGENIEASVTGFGDRVDRWAAELDQQLSGDYNINDMNMGRDVFRGRSGVFDPPPSLNRDIA
jgi:hypothetical protein